MNKKYFWATQLEVERLADQFPKTTRKLRNMGMKRCDECGELLPRENFVCPDCGNIVVTFEPPKS